MGSGSNQGRTPRIGWPGLNATDGGGGTRRDSSPAAGDRRRKPKSTLRVSIRRGLVSRMDYASCVVHLGPWRASGRSVAVRARTAAALHGGSRRRAAFSRSRSRSGSVLATRSVNGVWVIFSSA